jgi:hypothetical protein
LNSNRPIGRQKTNNYRNYNNRRACHYARKKNLLSGKPGQIFYDNIGTGRWATASENLAVNDQNLFFTHFA